jgi:hypothetical protein
VVLYFVSRESQRTQTTVREALRRGVVVVINSFSSTSGQMVTAALDQSEDEKPRIELKDGGPIAALRIQVGQAGPELVVKRGGSPQQATWTSNPPDFIDVSADPTASLRLQAKKAGTFTLVAAVKGEVSGSDAQSDPVAVTADPPTQTQATSVPFLGQGWGSMIIAILVAALVAALGFAGILGSEAVAGFYGALIGYVFHQATAQGSQTSVGADQGSRPPGGTS